MGGATSARPAAYNGGTLASFRVAWSLLPKLRRRSRRRIASCRPFSSLFLNGRFDVPLSRILLAVTLAASLLAVRASAQPVDRRRRRRPLTPPLRSWPTETGASPSPAAPGAAGPDVFFLPDAAGNLRRVLGYRYEDFFQSWRAGANASKKAPDSRRSRSPT